MSSSKKAKVSTMENEKTSKMPARFRNYLFFLIGAVVIGILIAGIKYFGTEKVQRSASVDIEFTYEGAAYNLTPSGEIFSIDAITSEKLIAEVLEKEGLSGKYTPEMISSNIEVIGYSPDDVIDRIKAFDSLYNFSESRAVQQNEYYPTTYNIKLYDYFDTNISDAGLQKLVNAIANAYKSYFINEYAYIFDTSSLKNLLDLDDYDFFQRLKILKNNLSIIKNYAQELYTLDSAFRNNDMSFNDIILKANSIENDYLNSTEASIITNVITVSAERLLNQYEYEITLLENDKNYKEKNLEELNALIDTYQTDGILYIGSGDSLVKIESNSKETYEKLIDEKRELSDSLIEINSEIDRYKVYIKALENNTSNKSASSTATSISETNKRILSLKDTFIEMLASYNDTIINEDSIEISDLRYNGAKILSGGFIVMIIKCVGPLFVIVMCICCIHAVLCAVKKDKKRA